MGTVLKPQNGWNKLATLLGAGGLLLGLIGFMAGRLTAAQEYGALQQRVTSLERTHAEELPRFHSNLALDAAQTEQIAALQLLVRDLVGAMRETNNQLNQLVGKIDDNANRPR